MKLYITLIIALFTTACEPIYEVGSTHQIPLDKREQAAKFIVDCATAANPHSDEEGEDLVEQCDRTATRLFGVYKPYCYTDNGGQRRVIMCDRVTTEPCLSLCQTAR